MMSSDSPQNVNLSPDADVAPPPRLADRPASAMSDTLSIGAQETVMYAPRRRGPDKSSFIWDIFETVTIDGFVWSKCMAPNCTYKNKGRNTTTLRNHAQKHQTLCDEAIAKRARMEGESHQDEAERLNWSKITDHFGQPTVQKYPKTHPSHIRLQRLLSLLFARNSIAGNVADSAELKNFCHALNPRFDCPGRKGVVGTINTIAEEVKHSVIKELNHVRRLVVGSDIWTQKGMRYSYMGVTIHYYDKVSKSIKSALLACREIKGHHTADAIRQLTNDILMEYSIESNKVFRYITDNGSNFVAAYSDDQFEAENDIEEEELEILPEQPLSTNTNAFGPANAADPFLEEEWDEDEETISIDNAIENDARAAAEEIAEFVDHETTYSTHMKHHLSCFVHSLMCVLRKVVDSDEEVGQLKKETFVLVRKFSKSTLGTQTLLRHQKQRGILYPRKLIQPSQTRWNSASLVFQRVWELREFLTSACAEREWYFSQQWSWRKIKALCDLLKPFAKFTDLTQGDKYSTINSVIPALLDLKKGLVEFSETSLFLTTLAIDIKTEIDNRFQKILDPEFNGVDSIYMIASSLDPICAKFLPQAMKDLAQKELQRMICSGSLINGETIAEPDETEDDNNADDMEYLQQMYPNFVSSTDMDAQTETVAVTTGVSSEIDTNQLVENYFSFIRLLDLRKKLPYNIKNPIEFWIENEQKYKVLAELAEDILAIPASSAPVERVFSQAGIASNGRRANIGLKTLENEILIKINSRFV